MNYFVDINGNDSNPGTREQPFRTIQRAADVVAAGDTCFVRSGTYRETVRPKRSGSQEKPIRFVVQDGETVILNGTDPIAGTWDVHQGSIFKTEVGREFNQLFVDGEMMIEARWPNARFDQLLDRNCWAKTGRGSRYGKLVDPDLAKTDIDWTEATAFLNVAHQFYTWTRPVLNHSKGNDTFEYDRDFPGVTNFGDKTTPWERNVYYLSGKLEALDSPCEWFLDKKDGALYLWPPNGTDPTDRDVDAKARDYGFDVDGLSHIEILGFQFFGCAFRFQDCHHCVVEDCHLRFPTFASQLTELDADRKPTTATTMDGSHNTIRSCSLAYSSTSGFTMLGSQNTIENCLVHDLCWNGSLSYEGIDVGPGKEEDPTGQCVVRRNTVFNTGNVGIMVNGMPGNVIEYNHVYDGGLASKDVSLVYTHLPLVDGTVIRYNWVHDCHSPHIALGIRGDDQTRGLSVHHNVVWNCDWDGIVIKGDRNRVYHNTCFNNAGCDILVFNTPEPLKPWRKQWPLLEQQNQNTKTFNNCAAVIRSERGDKGGPPGGQASNNFEGDEPILENPASFDFRPKEGSPLVDAGRIIPGLTEDYQGSAPDIGAYENGGEKWIPGCNLGDKEDWPASGDARH